MLTNGKLVSFVTWAYNFSETFYYCNNFQQKQGTEMEKDTAHSAVQARANACKQSVKLDFDNQSQPDSGHTSAEYGSGPDQSAAVPGGSPGTSCGG